jgi:CRISPR/Cas system-associated exonuclease Cas4 (RecB family)
LKCPAKFWYYKQGYRPLEIKKEILEFGKKLHEAVAIYYKSIPPNITAKEVNMYVVNALQKATGLPYRSLDGKYKRFIKFFSRFEKERIKKVVVKPLYIEKEYVREPFKGIIDAAFTDFQGNLVIVDWKSSLKQQLPDDYKLQGCIYGLLTDAAEVIFYSLLTGRSIKITKSDCRQIKDKIVKALEGIKKGVNTRNKGEHCKECEYQLACRVDEVRERVKLYEGIIWC